MLSDRGVRQRNGSDCVIAAVANAVGTTYKAVRAAWADTTRGGLTPGEIEYLLGRFGNWRTTFPRRPYGLGKWLKLHPAGRFVILVDNNPFLPLDELTTRARNHVELRTSNRDTIKAFVGKVASLHRPAPRVASAPTTIPDFPAEAMYL
jgi:hypothetical protein